MKRKLLLASSKLRADRKRPTSAPISTRWLTTSDESDGPTVWELLDDALTSDITSSCPFIPSRDILRHHEENVRIVSAQVVKYGATQTLLVGERRTKGPRKWYECELCGKSFSSRYYLDRHFDNRHASQVSADGESQREETGTYYCPAVEWCRIFSDQACLDMALELEPFYDRGSNGWGNDRWSVQRKISQAAHDVPCTTDAVQQAKIQCEQAVSSCFDTTQRENLEKVLCEGISCHGRLRDLLAGMDGGSAAGVLQQMHEWQDEWTYYYQEHYELGWTAFAFLFGLFFWYTYMLTKQRDLQPRRTSEGNRLLRKKPSTGMFRKKAKKQ
jgi:hypothetical protein